MANSAWMRLPSGWIERGGLSQFSWQHRGEGADNTAALMALTAIAHNVDPDSGVSRITYDRLCEITDLSRAKLSNGLSLLKKLKVIEARPEDARSTYRLSDYDAARGWAKFPVRSMYSGGRIIAFKEFKLRRVVELDALKLFFLFVSRRDQRSNCANVGYEKIVEYTGIKRDRIKSAISFLASLSLVYVEHVPSNSNAYGISNAYRIVGIDPTVHMGTRGRNIETFDL
jgi:hypothetical protein